MTSSPQPRAARGQGPAGCVGHPRSGAYALDMRSTCIEPVAMAKMIQIRHVPDDVHRKLKARATLAGMSLSEYLLAVVQR